LSFQIDKLDEIDSQITKKSTWHALSAYHGERLAPESTIELDETVCWKQYMRQNHPELDKLVRKLPVDGNGNLIPWSPSEDYGNYFAVNEFTNKARAELTDLHDAHFDGYRNSFHVAPALGSPIKLSSLIC
jgi:hypothetical protein